jgi:hypothetical protein
MFSSDSFGLCVFVRGGVKSRNRRESRGRFSSARCGSKAQQSGGETLREKSKGGSGEICLSLG